MAGVVRNRAIVALAAVFAGFAVFGVVMLIDSATGRDVFVETQIGSEVDPRAGSAPTELAATGTTIDTPAVTTDSATIEADQGDGGRGSIEQFEAIRNVQEKFTKFADVPSDQLDLAALTEPAPVNDNGASTAGQFRVACEYSHFGYDDPIIFPGQPGKSHLHMFFGNTEANAFTTQDDLVNTGGGTCSGFELNRSAYWTPALLDGEGNAIVPDAIIIYYKTKFPDAVTAMPQGLQMLAGNTRAESFETTDYLHWSCGENGHAYNETNRIPDCNGDVINASVQFPNCWDGVNLTSDDFLSHLSYADDHTQCPAGHKRLPQISILLYYPGTESIDGWHLSSDNAAGFNGPPGGTLHADWWGGWNDETMNLWINGCMKAARNCSYGQTGTPRQLAGLNPREVYEGPNVLPLPG